ncbi:iron-containing alcohol dehydrogenase [Thalassobaculum fulvum]|uniref:Alcohol dehydrogenase 2 n=1 Tax=Thalassobaculum fulvum TaxID=1633335 RepID=A0A918XSX9_9PROT|nr:iron-containing alcohol dehydrogenase [Thalassobaculum fulvum]GHD50913.1 iron-containing alcohol dehydrogenase [Thalassobaculum fulvum]
MTLISYLTNITFDHGAVKTLGAEMEALGMKRPLIVTDKGLVAAGLIDTVRGVIPNDKAATIFDGTPANPTEAAAKQALAAYREAGCDGIVAVGGGSSMDLAKAVMLMVEHPGALDDYAMIKGGVPKITANMPPLIAIPTTAGTGSEVGRGAVIVMDSGVKTALVSPHLIPKRAICDPDLTLDLPAGLTAATGMDALTHCIETYISPKVNPPAEAIALDGVARAVKHLERAVKDGHDREARWNMMMASMEGAMAFQKGLGAVHSMSHPLGALPEPRLHHGTLNAVIMPTVLRFNHDFVGDKYDTLRRIMGLSSNADLPQAIADMNARLKLPENLRAMGVTEAMIPVAAEQAEHDHCTPTNPRPVDRAGFEALFAEAMG